MSFAMPLNAEGQEALTHGKSYLLSCRCITEDGVEFTHMDPLAVPGGRRAMLPLGLFGDAQTGDLFVPVKIRIGKCGADGEVYGLYNAKTSIGAGDYLSEN